MKILIINEGFLPGNKYGGPPVSIKNFCTLLKENQCYIITKNHDLGEKTIYKGLKTGWNLIGNCKVKYLSDKKYNYHKFENVIDEIKPDLIYLNGLFQSAIIPSLYLSKKHKIPVLLAPRGELCDGAFKKKYKKIPYIVLLRFFGLLNNVFFQSTSPDETIAIRKRLAINENNIFELENIPSIFNITKVNLEKKKQEVKLIFLSRIVPKKNLLFALNLLTEIDGYVMLDIYGPIEDESYWNKCLKKIENLPENINVNYCGIVAHNNISDVFLQYHALLLPTLSENYGHVIIESMLSNCPVIISDQTPWTDINEYKAGWAIGLDNTKGFVKAIESIINMDNTEHEKLITNLNNYKKQKLNVDLLKTKYQEVLVRILDTYSLK